MIWETDSRNDMLTISVIRGTNSALHSFKSHVGKGSSSHDLTGDSLILRCQYVVHTIISHLKNNGNNNNLQIYIYTLIHIKIILK